MIKVPEINGHEVDEVLFNSNKPLLIHFHSNRISCQIANPILFFDRLANELQGSVKCVRIDTTDIDNIEESLMQELGVEIGDAPAVVAAYIEDGCPKAFKNFTSEFDYNEIYDGCCQLLEGKKFIFFIFLIFHINFLLEKGAAMVENREKEADLQVRRIKKLQEIDEILEQTKKPVFIYTYNKQLSHPNKRPAQKHFKDLSLTYKDQITFLQIDESDNIMPEVFKKGAQNFAGFYNKQIFGPIQLDENTIEKMDTLISDLLGKKIKNILRLNLLNYLAEPHLPTTECLRLWKMEECTKPVINFLYFPWEMKSLKRGIQFNDIQKQLIKEEKAEDFKFLSLNGEVAFSRHKLTDEEVKQNAGFGCGYKKNIEFFSKNRDVGIRSDIMISLKIDHNFPALVGYAKGKCIGKVDSREKESLIMEKFQPIVDELKSIK